MLPSTKAPPSSAPCASSTLCHLPQRLPPLGKRESFHRLLYPVYFPVLSALPSTPFLCSCVLFPILVIQVLGVRYQSTTSPSGRGMPCLHQMRQTLQLQDAVLSHNFVRYLSTDMTDLPVSDVALCIIGQCRELFLAWSLSPPVQHQSVCIKSGPTAIVTKDDKQWRLPLSLPPIVMSTAVRNRASLNLAGLCSLPTKDVTPCCSQVRQSILYQTTGDRVTPTWCERSEKEQDNLHLSTNQGNGSKATVRVQSRPLLALDLEPALQPIVRSWARTVVHASWGHLQN